VLDPSPCPLALAAARSGQWAALTPITAAGNRTRGPATAYGDPKPWASLGPWPGFSPMSRRFRLVCRTDVLSASAERPAASVLWPDGEQPGNVPTTSDGFVSRQTLLDRKRFQKSLVYRSGTVGPKPTTYLNLRKFFFCPAVGTTLLPSMCHGPIRRPSTDQIVPPKIVRAASRRTTAEILWDR